jgi:NifU-like protein involved in Fe-S cluster formation
MYSDAVLQRVRNPQRVGVLPEDAPDVGTGQCGTLDAGTMARIQVRVKDGRVVEARFKVFGCSAAIAAAGLMTEWLEGATVTQCRALTAAQVVEALALPEERVHVANVAVDAARQAMDDATRKAAGRER